MQKKISYILFLFSTLFIFGQVTLEISEVKELKVDQSFNLTVLLEISGENMEQETPLRMPDFSNFNIIGSASERNTVVVDGKSGNVINQLIYQYVLAPKQAGKIKFGSVLVTVNDKIYKTEPFEINVRENEKKSSATNNSSKKNEVYLNLTLEENTVYKNEPTIAILRVFSRDYGNFRKLTNIHFATQKNARVQPLHFTKTEIETKGGMASQVIGKYMIFPNETGNIEINSVSATVNNSPKPIKISSNTAKLSVKKLPLGMPLNYENAVGKFDISLNLENGNEIAEIEKPLNISLKISGKGNFGNFQIPRILDSPNYTSFAPQITSSSTPQDDQLIGQIIANYVVIPKKSGAVSINFENFSYFDPSAKNYTDMGAKSIQIDVKTHEEIAQGKSTLEIVNDYTNSVLETVNTPVLQTHNLKIKQKSSIDWRIVVGNLGIVFAVFSLFLVLQKRKSKMVKPASYNNSTASIAETEEIIRNKRTHHLEENIEYLKNLNKNKDFEKFFVGYQDLHDDFKNYWSLNSETDFKKHLEEHKGPKIADEYRVLSEKVQVEKYAPFHTEEHIDSLLQSIITFYSEIIK